MNVSTFWEELCMGFQLDCFQLQFEVFHFLGVFLFSPNLILSSIETLFSLIFKKCFLDEPDWKWWWTELKYYGLQVGAGLF